MANKFYDYFIEIDPKLESPNRDNLESCPFCWKFYYPCHGVGESSFAFVICAWWRLC